MCWLVYGSGVELQTKPMPICLCPFIVMHNIRATPIAGYLTGYFIHSTLLSTLSYPAPYLTTSLPICQLPHINEGHISMPLKFRCLF